MKTSLRSFSLLTLICAAAVAACSSTDNGVTVPSAGADASVPTNTDGSVVIDAGASQDGPVDSGATRPAPVFLPTSAYLTWFTLDAAFPFGVTQVHETNRVIEGASWGAHGGPLSNAFSGDSPQALRWVLPASATAAATMSAQTATTSSLPAKFFWGADGLRDMVGVAAGLHSYSTSAAAFAGEALMYSASFSMVTSRAFVNGYYSGVGVTDGNKTALVYAGLSPLSASTSATQANGLYVAPICDGKLIGAAGCGGPALVLAWTGASGPVVRDAMGNVFVAASVSNASPVTDKIYGLTLSEVIARAPVAASVVAELRTGGTGGIVALAPESASKFGWLLGASFTPGAPIYGYPYTLSAGQIAEAGTPTAAAVSPSSSVQGVGMFSDPEGDLWLAVNVGSKGYFVELRRKP